MTQRHRSFAITIVGTRSNRRRPWPWMNHSAWSWSVVPRPGGHEHVGVGGKQKRHLDRIEEIRLGSMDRVIDYIHAIRHRTIDGRQEIGGATGLVKAILRGAGVAFSSSAPNGITPLNRFVARTSQNTRRLNAAFMTVGVLRGSDRRV